MAADEVLLTTLSTFSRPVLRFYAWRRPAVSFGYFGKHADVQAAWTGRSLVRRWTGGGAVCHAADTTFSLVAPRTERWTSLRPSAAYKALHAHAAAWLSLSGVSATLADAVPGAGAERLGICFQEPVEADVLIDGRKVLGGAQRRGKYGVLYQGSFSISLPGAVIAFAQRLAAEVSPFVVDRAFLAEIGRVSEKYASDAWMRRF
jgi:lipoate-protein ligase A